MKINIDNVEVLKLSDIQKAVIMNDIHSSNLNEDLIRRVVYILQHKYEQSFKRLKDIWDVKLAERGVQFIPTDKDEYAKLVFSQPDYKDKAKREAEIKE